MSLWVPFWRCCYKWTPWWSKAIGTVSIVIHYNSRILQPTPLLDITVYIDIVFLYYYVPERNVHTKQGSPISPLSLQSSLYFWETFQALICGQVHLCFCTSLIVYVYVKQAASLLSAVSMFSFSSRKVHYASRKYVLQVSNNSCINLTYPSMWPTS